MKKTKLPLPLIIQDAIAELSHLGETTQNLVTECIDRLWNDAAYRQTDGKVFILTGDIPAMWIRDSVWQVRPLLRFVSDPEIENFVAGVIAAQRDFLAIDPYANAYNLEPNGNCWHKDFPDQSPWVFERKFELDSITSFWQLSLDFAEQSGSSKQLNSTWWSTTEKLVDLLEAETKHQPNSYRFSRPGNPAHDHLSHDGYGAPFANCGLVWSAFRPSDDACELPFHVASNLHAASQLRRLAVFAQSIDALLANRMTRIADGIEVAVAKFAIAKKNGKKILAYEVDGLGNQLFIDDANYPNLISLPFLGIARDSVYQSTREFYLAENNPWFFSGTFGSGVGSPHTGADKIWPLAIGMQGLTEDVPTKQLACLRQIERTRSKNGFIHESFNVEDPEDFTRDWFNWAEMTYVELAFQIAEPNRASR